MDVGRLARAEAPELVVRGGQCSVEVYRQTVIKRFRGDPLDAYDARTQARLRRQYPDIRAFVAGAIERLRHLQGLPGVPAVAEGPDPESWVEERLLGGSLYEWGGRLSGPERSRVYAASIHFLDGALSRRFVWHPERQNIFFHRETGMVSFTDLHSPLADMRGVATLRSRNGRREDVLSVRRRPQLITELRSAVGV